MSEKQNQYKVPETTGIAKTMKFPLEQKQEETCANCGKTKEEHIAETTEEGLEYFCTGSRGKVEKFAPKLSDDYLRGWVDGKKEALEPKNHSPLNLKKVRQPDTPSVNSKPPFEIAEGTQNQEKGCGKKDG